MDNPLSLLHPELGLVVVKLWLERMDNPLACPPDKGPASSLQLVSREVSTCTFVLKTSPCLITLLDYKLALEGVDNPLRSHLPKFPRLGYSFSQIVTGVCPEPPAFTSARVQSGRFHSAFHRRSSRVVRPVLSFHDHLIFASEPIHRGSRKAPNGWGGGATPRTPGIYTWVND